MELRSYNVERIFKDCTTCVLGNLVGTRKEELEKHAADILDMIRQIPTEEVDGKQCNVFGLCHNRRDGEQWTPYLQIIRMLLLLARRLDYVYWEGELKPDTVIWFKIPAA